MTSIGETLRRERLQKGLELQQVAQSTKIGTRMLQAMEQDDFSKLPGGVFTRSFVKQYAAALGLNPSALDEQLKGLTTGVEEPASGSVARKDVIAESKHYSLSEYNSSTNSGGVMMSVFWVVAAMAVTGLVYYMINRPQSAAPQPERAKTEERAPVVTAPTPAEPNPALSTSTKPVRVELTATDATWVSLTVDGKPFFSGVMKRGEKRSVEAAQKIRLVTGNAGTIQISWNQKPVDAIGLRGQVRAVEFTPEGSYVVPRASPKPLP